MQEQAQIITQPWASPQAYSIYFTEHFRLQVINLVLWSAVDQLLFSKKAMIMNML